MICRALTEADRCMTVSSRQWPWLSCDFSSVSDSRLCWAAAGRTTGVRS